MRLAASIGIDAFALNIGKDKYNDDQLDYAYAAAEATNFKVSSPNIHLAAQTNPSSLSRQ